MDWENGFAVSERKVIDIKIRHRFGVFFFVAKRNIKWNEKLFVAKIFSFSFFVICIV